MKLKEIKIPGPYSGYFNPVTILYTKIQNNTILVMRLVLDKLINFTDINIITWQQHHNSQNWKSQQIQKSRIPIHKKKKLYSYDIYLYQKIHITKKIKIT